MRAEPVGAPVDLLIENANVVTVDGGNLDVFGTSGPDVIHLTQIGRKILVERHTPLGERFVTLALAQTDERVKTDRPVSPAFLFAALLWHEVLAASTAREKKGERPIAALEAAMDDVLETQCEKLAITRKLTATMREVWTMQPRFEQRSGQRPYRLLELPRFRMAYDFLALRAASGEVAEELEIWWRSFQSADEETRRAMLMADAGPKPRRRRRRKKAADRSASLPVDAAADPFA